MSIKTASAERTSEPVASIAGRLLNGKSIAEAEAWLRNLAFTDALCDDTDRAHALALLGALAGMRSIAGSALTQTVGSTLSRPKLGRRSWS